MSHLVTYGLCDTDYTVHVNRYGFMYIFPTQAAKDVVARIRTHQCRTRPKKVFSYGQLTALGFIVPTWSIDGALEVAIPANCVAKYPLQPDMNESTKGDHAARCVANVIACGQAPMWKEPTVTLVEDKARQVAGIDLIVEENGKQWTVQIKADLEAGALGTGNLFLQVAEANPMKMK